MQGGGRCLLAAGLLALLPACKEEPDFDERFSAAEETIRTKAAEMDQALTKAERERAAREQRAPAEEQPAGGRGSVT